MATLTNDDKSGKYPDRTLEHAVRAAGISCRCLWEIKGPKDTGIAWMAAYLVGHQVCLVQTFKDGGGWNAFTPCSSGRIDDTVADVIARCSAEQT